MTDIRFTKEIRATLGTRFDVFKNRDQSFKNYYFQHQRRLILNCKYISLFGHFGKKKLDDYFKPSYSRKNFSLAGKKIDKELYKELEDMAEIKDKYTLEALKSIVHEGHYSILQKWLVNEKKTNYKGLLEDPNCLLSYD